MTSVTSAHGQKPVSGSVALEHLAALGVYLFALSWPLDVYQRVLWPVHLYHIALIPVFLCAAYDLKHNKRLRTPFELWWPCIAIFFAVAGIRVAGYPADVPKTGALCISFICLSHVMRNRQMMLRTLYLFLWGSTVAMALHLAAALSVIYPTVFDVNSGWVMASSYSMQEGIATALIAIVLIPALAKAARSQEYAARPARVVLWAALPGLFILYCIMSPCLPTQNFLPWHAAFLMPVVIPCVLILWGIARVTAKLYVARRYLEPGVYGLMIAALLSGVLILFWIAPEPAIGYVFLLAAISGYGQPSVLSESKTRLLPTLATITTVVLIVNMVFVLPGDPRNYERIVQVALKNKVSAQMLAYLEFVKTIAPEESRADYYIARVLLSQGNLSDASKMFSRSLHSAGHRLLPPPDEKLIDLFLNEMREKSSALAEEARGLAYEQSLVAAGRDRHALALLELRGKPDETSNLFAGPLASALAFFLEAPHLAETLATWNASLLLGVVKSSVPDTRIVAAPADIPDSILPFIVVADNSTGRDFIHFFSPQGNGGGIRLSAMHQPVLMDMPLAISPPEWKEWRKNNEGLWTLAFGKIAEIHIANMPEIYFSVYPSAPDVKFCSTVIFVPEKDVP